MRSEQPAVAVVAGAAGGIGRAIASELTREGYVVAGLDLLPSDTSLSLIADVVDAGQVQDALAEVDERLGAPSVAVSAHGIYEELPATGLAVEKWDSMLRLHLGGTACLARATVPPMVQRGGGHLINLASELALCGAELACHYAAAKGAIVGFTRALALELAHTGVTVNAVAPGPTDTPMLPSGSPWRSPDYLKTVPLRRLVAPEEVAHAVAFLVTEGAFFTGQVLSPNAGTVI